MQDTMSLRRLIVGALVLTVAVAATAAAADKIKVENLSDLPRFDYPVDGSVVGIIASDEAFNAFADDVRADIEEVLATYEIDDAATLQGYYSVLSRLDLMEGDYDAALARIEQIRALEDKEAGKLMTGLFAQAWIAARVTSR